ncbi:Oxidoreductase [plant metagenome]|uniref:Oxidoreductase n=1 Tax=plant metagenome TaxID=1297885 RepID=A0A484RMA7_9ZZZZ
MSVTVGVVGATSPAGQQVVAQLLAQGHRVVAYSRNPPVVAERPGLRWASLDTAGQEAGAEQIPVWIALCHIWAVPAHLGRMAGLGAQRVVCLSSTSRYTKTASSNSYEEALVGRLVQGEEAVAREAAAAGIGWTILRPTLIYGRNTDRNLSEIVRLIRRLHVFPLFGRAAGLRQPIYVDDVAQAAVLAAFTPAARDQAYNISGAEVLSYREMVTRIFIAMGLRPKLLTVPIWLFNGALACLRLVPRYRGWNADMVQRMNRDMVFGHEEARRDFGFDPQPFVLRGVDVGR